MLGPVSVKWEVQHIFKIRTQERDGKVGFSYFYDLL